MIYIYIYVYTHTHMHTFIPHTCTHNTIHTYSHISAHRHVLTHASMHTQSQTHICTLFQPYDISGKMKAKEAVKRCVVAKG